MRSRFTILLVAILFTLPASTQAAQMTLSDLRDICAGTDEVSTAACKFYILGVTEGAGIGAGIANDKTHFCITEGVSSQKMVLIVKKAMAQDLAVFPQDKDMPAVSFVAASMQQAFPCSNGTDEPNDFPANVYDPPASPPDGCSTVQIAQVDMLTGSEAYLFLRREVAAFKLGHTASQQILAALTEPANAHPTLFQEVVKVNTGLTDAKNTYLCASYILGRGTKGDEEYQVTNRMMITVYNRMALQTRQFREKLKAIAADNDETPKSSQLKLAEVMSSLEQDRKAAGSDLVDATTMSAMLTIYTGDPNAPKADTLKISCIERQALLADLASLTKTTKVDEFTKNAGLLEDFFKMPYKCKP